MRTKVLPVLAAGLIALQATACQWMGGEKEAAASGRATSQQTAATQGAAQQPTQVAPAFVQRIQTQLEAQGYDVGAVDGMWGAGTSSALRTFQRDKGMQPTGQIDEQTLTALGMAPAASAAQRKPMRQGAMMEDRPFRQQAPGQRTSRQQTATTSPDMMRDIQQRLEARGYDVGEVDGIWGARTARALQSFQQDSNINPSGRVDAGTLAALGMAGPQVGEVPSQERPMGEPEGGQ